jgi:hypothetical protein
MLLPALQKKNRLRIRNYHWSEATKDYRTCQDMFVYCHRQRTLCRGLRLLRNDVPIWRMKNGLDRVAVDVEILYSELHAVRL